MKINPITKQNFGMANVVDTPELREMIDYLITQKKHKPSTIRCHFDRIHQLLPGEFDSFEITKFSPEAGMPLEGSVRCAGKISNFSYRDTQNPNSRYPLGNFVGSFANYIKRVDSRNMYEKMKEEPHKNKTLYWILNKYKE